MSDEMINEMRRWLSDLRQIVSDQDMQDDDDIQRQLSLIEIELDGLGIDLPDVDEAVSQLLIDNHKASVSESVLIVLQTVLGYYAMPDRIKGDNEPVLGSEHAHRLKKQLQKHEVDLFAVKYELVELLAAAQKD